MVLILILIIELFLIFFINSLGLAELYYHSSQYAKSEAMYLECFALRKTGLGPDHPHTLNTMYDLAVLYDTMGEDLEKAQKMYAGCIAKCLAVLGPNEH